MSPTKTPARYTCGYLEGKYLNFRVRAQRKDDQDETPIRRCPSYCSREVYKEEKAKNGEEGEALEVLDGMSDIQFTSGKRGWMLHSELQTQGESGGFAFADEPVHVQSQCVSLQDKMHDDDGANSASENDACELSVFHRLLGAASFLA